ncbi:MAG: hypothetical protein ABL897_14100 [Hyphomicrobium sp.]
MTRKTGAGGVEDVIAACALRIWFEFGQMKGPGLVCIGNDK